jgi:hypothetical protein
MRRPNPRVLIPVLIAAAAGGVVGYFVTAASCAPGSCRTTAAIVASAVALVAGLGVGVVVVLAVRSFAEWRVHGEREVLVVRDDSPADPPTC